jgi:hypothetical protein
MNKLTAISNIGRRQPPIIDIERTYNDKPDTSDLFMTLFSPSIGEHVALFFNDNSIPQSLRDKTTEILTRYKAGEWATRSTVGAKTTTANTSYIHIPLSADVTAETVSQLAAASNSLLTYAEPSDSDTIEELYFPGSLLYAMYPPQEERYKSDNDYYEMSEAIDTFLEYAGESERQAFIFLYRGGRQ